MDTIVSRILEPTHGGMRDHPTLWCDLA
jgi:hypothetical protein